MDRLKDNSGKPIIFVDFKTKKRVASARQLRFSKEQRQLARQNSLEIKASKKKMANLPLFKTVVDTMVAVHFLGNEDSELLELASDYRQLLAEKRPRFSDYQWEQAELMSEAQIMRIEEESQQAS